MMLFSKCVPFFIAVLFSVHVSGQCYVRYDHISRSELKDGLDNRYGVGSLGIISGGFNIPLSIKYNEKNQSSIWAISGRCAYGRLENHGQAEELNPDDIFNGSLNLTHIRPISERWSFIASIGGGVYAPSHELSSKSILANGGIVLVCKLNKNLSLGAGVGVSNVYGIPMVMPMLYLSWLKTGRYEFKIDMSSGVKVASSVWVGNRLKLELTAFDVDGMSAVMNVNGKSMIYSATMLRSYIAPSFKLSRHIEFYAGIGGCWLRGITVSERTLKGFLNALNDNDDDDNLRFVAALHTFAGIRINF